MLAQHRRRSALLSRQADAESAPTAAPDLEPRLGHNAAARRVMTNRSTHGLARSCKIVAQLYLFRMFAAYPPAGCLLTNPASLLVSGESTIVMSEVAASKVISFSLALSCLSCVPWRARRRSPVCGFSSCRPFHLCRFSPCPSYNGASRGLLPRPSLASIFVSFS
jgi:hypothetical protein